MYEFTLVCIYCNHTWEITSWKSIVHSEDYKCPICGDKNIKVRKNVKKDYY